jgi:hypothetical protein
VFGERGLFVRKEGIAWPVEAGVREVVERAAGEVKVCRACGCEATPGVRLAEFMMTMNEECSSARRRGPFICSFAEGKRQ